MKPDKETPTTAPEWIARLAEGPLTRADKVALTDWLRESPRHVREFLELTLLHEDLKGVQLDQAQVDAWVQEARDTAVVPISSGIATKNVRAEVIALQPAQTRATPRGRWPAFWALAASIIVAFTMVGGYYWWSDGRYVTGFGEQKIITLADGSVVTLNTSSALKVDLTDDKRALKLIRGEAFFRVAHDPSRPFEVTAQDATVKAVGTQFNVRIAPTATVVSVVDGAVEIREREVSKPPQGETKLQPVVRLARGEEARIVRAAGASTEKQRPISVIKAQSAVATRSAAWINGRIEFEDAPLVNVFNEFRRYREFTVEIEEPLRGLKLTGSFDAQDPESAFEYIETLPGVAVERPTPRTFIVRKE
ncbi:MAG TPA: FecR domain-containing protein [Steroidobacter sp.]